MEIFGLPITSFYLLVLLGMGIITLLYVLFGDVLEGIGEGIPFLNPILILVFIIFLSAIGYLLESLTDVNSFIIVGIATLGSFFLTTLLNVFVLVPLSSAEESLAYTEESLKGRLGKTIVPIPKDGFGEVLIENKSGRIAKAAASFDNTEIKEGMTVIVIDVKDGNLYVRPFDEKSIYNP